MVLSRREIFACTLLAISPTLVAAQSGLRGLHSLAKAKGRYFGTSTDQLWNNKDSAYLNLTGSSSEFGVSTPGNQQKWDATEKSRNVFSFTNADYQVARAKNHKQAVRGHTLVNEAFEENGAYRNSVFYSTIGPAYIPIALRAARIADPKAKLYLNDYNTDWTGSKSDAYYKLTKSLLAQGVPLDGIGFRKLEITHLEPPVLKFLLPEGHLIVNSFEHTVQENFQRFADLGLDIAITELDIRMTLPATDILLKAQAENYAYIIKSCLAVSKCVGITTWDTSDDVSGLVNYTLPQLILARHKYSWIPSVNPGQGAALLFNEKKQPKPAYYSVADALAAATNDYNTDWTGAKSDAIYNLAKDLKAQGVPLDGIGFRKSRSPIFIIANFERFADLGLEIAITELDIRYTLPGTAALIASQAENYKYVINSCLAVSRCVGVTVWDTSDDYSWIPSVFPGQGDALLFDSNKKPKPAYYSVADALAAATVQGTWSP
ncbi:unnamed protein product [Rhizoctonia solani]|uniref:endo-1,4-beta-xylanase n=1 Tax=Rhizoctonia solani TaxID=456999 RepID=A0A8H3BDP9_9AGAM|nr:unnamed protein product [Rhizoctonia solani]